MGVSQIHLLRWGIFTLSGIREVLKLHNMVIFETINFSKFDLLS